MANVRVILKNGIDFVVPCEKFTVKKTKGNDLFGYSIEGAKHNVPLYLDISQIVAILELNEKTEG